MPGTKGIDETGAALTRSSSFLSSQWCVHCPHGARSATEHEPEIGHHHSAAFDTNLRISLWFPAAKGIMNDLKMKFVLAVTG